MACYVLVHGAWSGGWVYQRVARALRMAGHDVYTPTLTGLGERAHLAGLGQPINLSVHVQDVLAVLECEALQDVILCGHSYGGMVISGVASAAAERIRTVFYLDAFLPADGQSLFDLGSDAVRTRMLDSQRLDYGRVAPLQRPAIAGEPTPGPPRRMSQSLLCFTEGVRMTGAERAVANRTYVYASENQPSSFARFHAALQHDPAWLVHTVATGHMVMLEDPEGLTGLLLAEAGR